MVTLIQEDLLSAPSLHHTCKDPISQEGARWVWTADTPSSSSYEDQQESLNHTAFWGLKLAPFKLPHFQHVPDAPETSSHSDSFQTLYPRDDCVAGPLSIWPVSLSLLPPPRLSPWGPLGPSCRGEPWFSRFCLYFAGATGERAAVEAQ